MKARGRGRLAARALAALSMAALAACSHQPGAPTNRGVCWALAQGPNGQSRFNPLAQGVPDLEHCAAQLEAMRLRFLGLGTGQTAVVGAYQGQFLFDNPDGVFTAQSIDGFRYPFLVRTGDGRLAIPGAMPQAPANGGT